MDFARGKQHRYYSIVSYVRRSFVFKLTVAWALETVYTETKNNKMLEEINRVLFSNLQKRYSVGKDLKLFQRRSTLIINRGLKLNFLPKMMIRIVSDELLSSHFSKANS